MAGLDPAIHPLRKSLFEDGWIRGSSPRMTQSMLQRLAQIPIYSFKQPSFRILATHCARALLVSLPSTLRGGGTPKGAPWYQWPQHVSRLRKTEATETPSDVPPQRFLRPWGLTYRHRREQARHPGRLPHPSPAPSQPFKAEPRSGLGRLPKAPRVHACEAWPRAPHPTGLGYPAPIKLSLCPTSVTPLEAPLMDRTGEL
jgi:hypothetical protein